MDIYPDSIAELLVPDLAPKEQERIVGAVRAEIDKQDSIKAEIAKLRGEIDAVVRQAVHQVQRAGGICEAAGSG